MQTIQICQHYAAWSFFHIIFIVKIRTDHEIIADIIEEYFRALSGQLHIVEY